MTITFDRQYRHEDLDRREWGDGPWQTEPDKAQWIDPETGLDCLLVRNPMGALCGYVGVSSVHPWHGKDYGACTADPPCAEYDDEGFRNYDCTHTPEHLLEVHGGITFAAGCGHGEDESRGICHVPPAGRPDDVWWFGFDCNHSQDLAPRMEASLRKSDPTYRERFPVGSLFPGYSETYKPVPYVVREVGQLAAQLAAVAA